MNMLSAHNNFRDVQLAASDIYFFKRHRPQAVPLTSYQCMQALYTKQHEAYCHQDVFKELGFQLNEQGCIPCDKQLVHRLKCLWSSPRWHPKILVFSNRVNNNPANSCSNAQLAKLLQACLEHQQPIILHTTYFLFSELMPMLKEMATFNLIHIVISLGSSQPEWHKRWEPHTKPYSRRFQLMQALSNEGIPCGFLLDPVIPGESLQGLYELFRLASINGIQWAGFQLWNDSTERKVADNVSISNQEQLKKGFISQFTHYAKRFGLNRTIPIALKKGHFPNQPSQGSLF
jgi:hypothetical protein